MLLCDMTGFPKMQFRTQDGAHIDSIIISSYMLIESLSLFLHLFLF